MKNVRLCIAPLALPQMGVMVYIAYLAVGYAGSIGGREPVTMAGWIATTPPLLSCLCVAVEERGGSALLLFNACYKEARTPGQNQSTAPRIATNKTKKQSKPLCAAALSSSFAFPLVPLAGWSKQGDGGAGGHCHHNISYLLSGAACGFSCLGFQKSLLRS